MKNKSFIGYLMNIFLLGETLFEKIDQKKFIKHLIEKRKEIFFRINYSKYETNKEVVSNFLSSNYIKNNFNELSDFVKEYYNKYSYIRR